MIMGIAEVIEKQSEESIEVFLQSLLFFLHNLFCNIPESQRNEVIFTTFVSLFMLANLVFYTSLSLEGILVL